MASIVSRASTWLLSYDTLGRVFVLLDSTKFEQGFSEWAHSLPVLMAGSIQKEIIAIVGKTSRRSHNRRKGQNPLHLVIPNIYMWVVIIIISINRTRTGYAQENLSVIKRIALNMLKKDKSTNIGITAKSKKAGWDNQCLKHIIAN